MRMAPICLGTTAALGISLCATIGQAAPVGSAAGRLTADGAPPVIERAAIQRCWFDDGVRHCRLIAQSDDEPDTYFDDEPEYEDGPPV